MSDQDKNGFCIPRIPAVPITPEVQRDESSAVQLAAGGTLDFEFNIDGTPIIDLFVRCDRAIEAAIFSRIGPTDTFAQIGGVFGPIPAPSLHPAASHLINAQRVPGSQCRIRLTNNSGGATTILVAQVHARAM